MKKKNNKDIGVIPPGPYCYRPISFNKETGEYKIDVCPYWSINPDMPAQMNGYCYYLEKGDWELGTLSEDGGGGEWKHADGTPLTQDEIDEIPDCVGAGLLWDQVKECGINNEDDYFGDENK